MDALHEQMGSNIATFFPTLLPHCHDIMAPAIETIPA
jgi:hypothetical protein